MVLVHCMYSCAHKFPLHSVLSIWYLLKVLSFIILKHFWEKERGRSVRVGEMHLTQTVSTNSLSCKWFDTGNLCAHGRHWIDNAECTGNLFARLYNRSNGTICTTKQLKYPYVNSWISTLHYSCKSLLNIIMKVLYINVWGIIRE